MLSVSFLTRSLCGLSLHSLPVTNPLSVSHPHSLSLPLSLSHVSIFPPLCVSFSLLGLALLCLYFSPVTVSFFFSSLSLARALSLCISFPPSLSTFLLYVYLLSHSQARQAQASAESCWLFFWPLTGRRSGQRQGLSYRIISTVSIMLKSMFRYCVRVGQRIYFSRV